MARPALVRPEVIKKPDSSRQSLVSRFTDRIPRQVVLLAAAQALFQTASIMVGTVGALAGSRIAPVPQLATLPNSAVILGTVLMTVPASLWMGRVGRKRGFITGAFLGVLGGLIGALGLWLGSLGVLALGTFFIGTYQGFAQYYRFAAAETVDPASRAKAISWVLSGGIVAALLGPNLARLGAPLLAEAYVGSFLALAVVSLVAAGTLLGVQVPAPQVATSEPAPARSLSTIARQPTYLIAVFGAATAYGIMVLAMTATPLAMVQHQHQVSDAAFVIQVHVLGMFLPSFFSGPLIGRFGVVPIMLSGVALLTGHVGIVLSGTELPSFASALLLLGVGWNFLYVGATTLVTSTYTAAERGRAQATNDMLIFGISLVSSLASGVILQTLGWQTMNLLLLPWLALCALALVGLGIGQRRQGAVLAKAG